LGKPGGYRRVDAQFPQDQLLGTNPMTDQLWMEGRGAGRSDDAGDLPRFEAGGADIEPLRGAANDRTHRLDVGVPPPTGPPVRVRDSVAKARLLAADVAGGSHRKLLEPKFWVRKKCPGSAGLVSSAYLANGSSPNLVRGGYPRGRARGAYVVGRSLDVALARRWCRACLEALSDAREEIDALNVYPVPDGDTGTNLYLTVEAAVQSAEAATDHDLATIMRAAARGALLGARGNSGVILSQMFRGAAAAISEASAARADGLVPADLAQALAKAAEMAYVAVAEPVEGTMLTVAREAAQAATACAGRANLVELAMTTAAAAREALARTPEQLEILRRSGVVDAGGRGLTVLYDAFEQVVTGRRGTVSPPVQAPGGLAAPATLPGDQGTDLTPHGPAFEVMYLLDAPDSTIPTLRRALAPLGDSLLIVGGDELWNVHVHVDDVGAAIEAGLAAGRPYRIRVSHFADRLGADQVLRRRQERGVVCVAAGDGLAQLFASCGAAVVRTAPTHRPSTGELLEAIRSLNCAEVVVLPNDPHVVGAAQAAAGEAAAKGIRVAVLPTRAQVQGIAALAVHDAMRPFDADVVSMTTAAGETRYGAVTVAMREAVTTAGVCRTGDVLGAVGGDFVVIANTPEAAAREVVDRLLAGGGELVTLVTGVGIESSLVPRLSEYVRRTYPAVDLAVHEGGQPRYLLLIGVE
jgi:DAK2 domain fusion protein YloV